MTPPADPPPSQSPIPNGEETPYDLDAIRDVYGDVPVVDRTFTVRDATEHAEARASDALGGARVVVARERDGAVLYANVRGDDAEWDVPGGGREPGESLERTALRELREEVGLSPVLDDLACVHRLTFDDGDRAPTGLWVHFAATVTNPGCLDVQSDELAATTWRTTRPEDVDDLLARALDEYEQPIR